MRVWAAGRSEIASTSAGDGESPVRHPLGMCSAPVFFPLAANREPRPACPLLRYHRSLHPWTASGLAIVSLPAAHRRLSYTVPTRHDTSNELSYGRDECRCAPQRRRRSVPLSERYQHIENVALPRQRRLPWSLSARCLPIEASRPSPAPECACGQAWTDAHSLGSPERQMGSTSTFAVRPTETNHSRCSDYHAVRCAHGHHMPLTGPAMTKDTPSANSSPIASARARASQVLPTPPGLTSVSNRVCLSSTWASRGRWTIAGARARPF
jgi:hypothetical protein